VIVDKEERIIAVKPSQPKEGWAEICKEVQGALVEFGKTLSIKKYKQHDRGDFGCFSMGLSSGGGQKVSFI
jgi:hypothetical protein